MPTGEFDFKFPSLMLVVGPTGSGKSYSLSIFLDKLKSRKKTDFYKRILVVGPTIASEDNFPLYQVERLQNIFPGAKEIVYKAVREFTPETAKEIEKRILVPLNDPCGKIEPLYTRSEDELFDIFSLKEQTPRFVPTLLIFEDMHCSEATRSVKKSCQTSDFSLMKNFLGSGIHHCGYSLISLRPTLAGTGKSDWIEQASSVLVPTKTRISSKAFLPFFQHHAPNIARKLETDYLNWYSQKPADCVAFYWTIESLLGETSLPAPFAICRTTN